MKFLTLSGKGTKNVNLTPYLIDWTGRKVSKPQQKVKDFLFPFFKTDQVLEEFLIPGSKLRVDLMNIDRKIVIEVSPKQHFEFNPFLHGGERLNFLSQIKRDEQKRKWVEKCEFRLVELTDEDLKDLTKERFRDKFEIDL